MLPLNLRRQGRLESHNISLAEYHLTGSLASVEGLSG